MVPQEGPRIRVPGKEASTVHTPRIASTLILGTLALPAHAGPQSDIRGEVARVVDGDTLHLPETPKRGR